MRGTTLTTKRIAMPKLRAVKFADKRTKRNKTRQAKFTKVMREYNG
jgi:hypothetical protein